jgi:hypothetical protein
MSIPGSVNPLFLGAAGQATGGGGYQIERSVRFNSPDSAYLSRTPASSSNRKTWTWAGWVKLSSVTTAPSLFMCRNGGGDSGVSDFIINSDGTVVFTGAANTFFTTTQLLRDFSAWYHLVLSVDTTAATAGNRIRFYLNGSQVTTFNNSYNPTQNFELAINQAAEHDIGGKPALTEFFNGYLADIHFIDGQALDPTSFGEFDTNNVWQPIDASGLTYGTNGFHLPFSDNSTAAALGTDTSGNGNTWTVNNLSAGGAQPALYSSPNLYTNAADVIANGTPLSSSSTFSNVYVYLVTNGGGDVGSKVFTADGSGTIGYNTNWTWLHRIGASWTSSGGYNDTEWDLFTWGSQTVATNYIMNNSAPLHMLVSSAGSPQQVSGTIATFNSTPNSGAGNDSLVDSPTNGSQTDTGVGGEVVGNYATLNPLDLATANTLAPTNGNLEQRVFGGSSTWGSARGGTFTLTSGKWYWECVVRMTFPNNNGPAIIGILQGNLPGSYVTSGANALGVYYQAYLGQKYVNGVSSSYGTSWSNAATDYTLGVALDIDGGTITFYLNGVSQGAITLYSNSNGWKPHFAHNSSYGASEYTDTTWNFGQRPFAYPLSGFKALCTTNLPEPTIADGSTAMDVALYTGNGSTQTISGLNFSPDLVWIKERNNATSHCIFDSVRGTGKVLSSNNTNPEDTTTARSVPLILTGSLFLLQTRAAMRSATLMTEPTSLGPGTPAAQPSPTQKAASLLR